MTPKSERSQPVARPEAKGAKRGRLVAQVLLVLFAAAFIVLSTVEVERQVFGLGPRGATLNQNCAFALRSFEESVDRGLAHAALEHTRGKAEEVFEDQVTTQLDSVRKHCKDGPDREAFIAATRYRDAAEGAVDAQRSNLDSVRRAVEARLEN